MQMAASGGSGSWTIVGLNGRSGHDAKCHVRLLNGVKLCNRKADCGERLLTLHKSPTVPGIFMVVVNVSLPISIGLAERPLGPTAATRFGHFEVRHERLVTGNELVNP